MNQDIQQNEQHDAPLREAIRKGIPESAGLEVVDIVAVPSTGDRMARVRTIEEALEDFDRFENERTRTYLVQLRPKGARSDEAGAATYASPNLIDQMVQETMRPVQSVESNQSANNSVRMAPSEPIYLPDGKLNVDFLFRNANVLFESKEYALARNIYKTILQGHERPAQALYWIGRTFEAEGKIDQALKTYDHSLAFTPAIETFQKMAAIYMSQKKDSQAAEVLERALQLKDLSPTLRCEVLKACGNSWVRAGQADRAITHYRTALTLDPRSEWLLSNLGVALLKSKRANEAVQAFQSVLSMNARNAKALSGLGAAFAALGNSRAAHDAFAKSLDIDIQNPEAVFQIVKHAYELKSYATATRLVEQYVDVAPINVHLLYSLAGLQFHLGRLADARKTLSRVFSIQEGHAGAKELLELIEKYGLTADA
jgi:tetratricopeptide (TPR) repeat protein